MEHDQAMKASEAVAASAPTMTSPEPEPPPSTYSPPAPELPEANVAPVVSAETPAAAYPAFYDSLSPYGKWIYLEGYGYCWQPSVVNYDVGWRPYFDCGHWTYTDCGWYWVSDYSWGWAPFHYGRWFNHHRLGWCWAPDNVWGPSWVSWRYSDDYCGWAPLPPSACFQTGIGLSWWGRPAAVGCDFGLGWDSFAFIDWHHFHEHRLRDYGLARHEINRVYNHTVVVNNISHNHSRIINAGIAPERVFAATHIPVRQVALREVSRPISAGRRFDSGRQTLEVYRPHIPSHGATTVAVASSAEAGRHQRPTVAGFAATRDRTPASRLPGAARYSETLRNNQSLPIAPNPRGARGPISNGPTWAAGGRQTPSAPAPGVVEQQTRRANAQERMRPTTPEVTQRQSELASSQQRYAAPKSAASPALPTRSASLRQSSAVPGTYNREGTYSRAPLASQATPQPHQPAARVAETPYRTPQPSYFQPRYTAGSKQWRGTPMSSGSSTTTRLPSPAWQSERSYSALSRTYSPSAQFQGQTAQRAYPQPRYSAPQAHSYTPPAHTYQQSTPSFAARAYTPERSYSGRQQSYSPRQSFTYSQPSHAFAASARAGASYSSGAFAPHAAQTAPSSPGRSNDGRNSPHR